MSRRTSYLYLFLHNHDEESDEIDDENGPEDGNVEHLKAGHEESQDGRVRDAVPEMGAVKQRTTRYQRAQFACTDSTPQSQYHCSNWNHLYKQYTRKPIALLKLELLDKYRQQHTTKPKALFKLESLVQTVQHKTNITVQAGTKRGQGGPQCTTNTVEVAYNSREYACFKTTRGLGFYSSQTRICIHLLYRTSHQTATTYQNLNSGRRRMNGLNSASAFVGSEGPSAKDKEKIQRSEPGYLERKQFQRGALTS